MWIDCGITSEPSEVINENMKYLTNSKEINLSCKSEKYIKGNRIGNEGCAAIFMNAKCLSKLERLDLWSKVRVKIGCGMTDTLAPTIINNTKFMKRLHYLDIESIII